MQPIQNQGQRNQALGNPELPRPTSEQYEDSSIHSSNLNLKVPENPRVYQNSPLTLPAPETRCSLNDCWQIPYDCPNNVKLRNLVNIASGSLMGLTLKETELQSLSLEKNILPKQVEAFLQSYSPSKNNDVVVEVSVRSLNTHSNTYKVIEMEPSYFELKGELIYLLDQCYEELKRENLYQAKCVADTPAFEINIRLHPGKKIIRSKTDIQNLGWGKNYIFTGTAPLLCGASQPCYHLDPEFDSQNTIDSRKVEFLNCVMENNISTIIDLRPFHSIESKLAYYPEQEQQYKFFGNYQLFSEKHEQLDQAIELSKIKLDSSNGQLLKPYSLSIIHCLNWKDRSSIDTQTLLKLGEIAIAHLKNNKNILIHCEAGVGRTGTLITYIQSLLTIQQMQEKSLITRALIEEITDKQIASNKEIRPCIETEEQRNIIVQTIESYYVNHSEPYSLKV